MEIVRGNCLRTVTFFVRLERHNHATGDIYISVDTAKAG